MLKPRTRGSDDAIWNHLRLNPFEVTVPADEMDRELPAKLLAEAEAILAWAVAGAVRWYQEGLGTVPDVHQPGQSWRSESDPIARFLEDCCMIATGGRTQARELYAAYRQWAERGGEPGITETAFGRRLTGLGFAKHHSERGRIYERIGVSGASIDRAAGSS